MYDIRFGNALYVGFRVTGAKGESVKNLIWILLFVVVAVVLWQLPFLIRVFRWLVVDAYRFSLNLIRCICTVYGCTAVCMDKEKQWL